MTLANSQLEEQNFSAARATAERALREAPDEGARQDAINMLARIAVAEGQAELAADRLSSARTAFESVLNLQPPPAGDLLAQAQQGLDQVTQAENQLSTQELVQQSWQSYDAAMASQDWNAAISALDAIIGMTGPAPTREEYPSPPYDQRTYNVAEIQAQVRLIEAERLQSEGNLAAAQAQYDAVLTGAGPITQATRQAAANAVQRLNTASGLWSQVNAAQAAADWATMRDALQALSDLEGFGPQARNPQGSQTVANLLDLANDRLEQAAQTPTATSIPPSPTAEPPTPTATDIPQPPTTVPLPTATDEPLPTATDEPLPTATDEPLPTATDEPLPTATPPEEVVYETYNYPSNLFSIDVPQDWSSQDESEPGLARVDFQAPQDAYGLSARVSALPADAPGQEQLLRDFLQDEFGDNTDFAVEEQIETRPNGQLSLGFSYRATPFIGVSFVVPGRVVGQIDGDKLSLLVVLYEGGEDERTPERVDIINTMLDSYTIDPAVALPS
jgi:tetratricopeptide (TPR) repeat protein